MQLAFKGLKEQLGEKIVEVKLSPYIVWDEFQEKSMVQVEEKEIAKMLVEEGLKEDSIRQDESVDELVVMRKGCKCKGMDCWQ